MLSGIWDEEKQTARRFEPNFLRGLSEKGSIANLIEIALSLKNLVIQGIRRSDELRVVPRPDLLGAVWNTQDGEAIQSPAPIMCTVGMGATNLPPRARNSVSRVLNSGMKCQGRTR